ncbi:MAG TPA: hypothetical protein VGD81_12450 [Opitutaceae bacterium]
MLATPEKPATGAGSFDWPLAYDAEAFLRRQIDAFLAHNTAARQLAGRMETETGTDFYEWVDHFTLDPSTETELAALGLREEAVPAPKDWRILYHPRAMMPRVVLVDGGTRDGAPKTLAIRAESIVDFASRHNLGPERDGCLGASMRQLVVSDEGGFVFRALERLAYRGFMIEEPTFEFVSDVVRVRELWRMRRRDFPDDADAVAHAFALQAKVIGLVGRDVACELFFAEERAYWELRNTAARIQKRRQDLLGLGWGNHDHHTFRSSRRFFADFIRFLLNFGFEKRERYYAGAEAGWGAQISEHPVTGITVFADVDLTPDETEIDFSTQPLPPAPRLGTVGLWCGLHGDSFLQAGMHHLEARFDFAALRDQLEQHGVKTMRPFSDFPFLKQAFTEGERWAVSLPRVEKLRRQGLITAEQEVSFIENGAIGSHLENLERKGGYKGFNQKSVSVIIAATDPRAMQHSHA